MERGRRLLGRGCGNGPGARQAFGQPIGRKPPGRPHGHPPLAVARRRARCSAGRAVGRLRVRIDLW
ncbi:hypothetical protein BDI4_240036 [Burkholderia diffusa]|nr:hypothetical protein BDI4_240036 [Burkholderia diffusa]